MEKKVLEKINLNFNYQLTGFADYEELLKGIGLSEFKNIGMKKAQVSKEKHFSIITAVDSKTGNNKNILVYGMFGQPTFKQMLEISYDHGSDIDLGIVLFHDYNGLGHGLMNNKNMAKSFTDMLNDCHHDTYFVEIIETKNDDTSIGYQYEVISDPESKRKSCYRRLPSKRDLQESEIWIYYFDFVGAFDDYEEQIDLAPDSWTSCWPMIYPFHGLRTFISWNDEGISIIAYSNSEKGADILYDIFFNQSYGLEKIFDGCKIHDQFMDTHVTDKFCLVVEVDKRPISDLFMATAKEKYKAVEQLRVYEMRFELFINRYFSELKMKEISA